MKFPAEVRTTYVERAIEAYFDGRCPSCHSTDLKIRSSRIRTVPDLGTPIEKRLVRIKMATFECHTCGATFSPTDPDFPAKFEYSLAIIKYALDCFYKYNTSGTNIARALQDLHQVAVPVDTINSWVKLLSKDYCQARAPQLPPEGTPPIKTCAVDGTFVSVGKEIMGKKKPVDSLSVTKTKNGTYLLTWFRKNR